MQIFEKSKWIWADCTRCDDQYTEYVTAVGEVSDHALFRISCDTDYALFINGEYIASNQYGDFEHYKIYDTIDVTAHLSKKSNVIKLIVYYCGVNTQRYRRGEAGLIYELVSGDRILAYSDTHTMSRVSPTYISGLKRFVSSQLGFSFTYDATKESNTGYAPSVRVHKSVSLFPRPIPKHQVLPGRDMQAVKKEPWGYLIDLGSEVVGFAALDLVSSCEQTIRVAYGESLDDGRVRATIKNRSFFYEYRARKGQNVFADYMLRLSGRYLEVTCDAPVEIRYVGILPQVYEVEEVPCQIDSRLDQRIYEICINTLRLCMMEHYADTPWREQCLYAFDSRNQMLFGYDAFKNQNRDYARSNLVLLGEDRRGDGLLSICSPCGTALTIPSFSLYYVLAMREYADHTRDLSLIKAYTPRMEAILDEFLHYADDRGLIQTFSGEEHWNFYDWSQHLAGKLRQNDAHAPDLVINCLFVMALDSLESMCKRVGVPFRYTGRAQAQRRLIRQEFASDSGLLSHHKDSDEYTTLGNALAVLCGVVSGDKAVELCDRIVREETTPSSLSMNIWKYQALLQTDAKRYREYMLNEIRSSYKMMLDAGSTTVWETLKGSADFGNAGSLCHGWSAVPVYVFHRLGIAKARTE